MSPIHVLFRLVRFSPGYFTLCCIYAVVIYLFVPLLLGLATQAFFDAVAGQRAGLTAWSAIALLVGVQIGEAVADPVLGNPWSPVQQKSHVLLRRNLVAGILHGYGRFGLQAPAGEIVSRFRDDPEIIADGLDALCDLIGRTLFAVVAAVVMWRISPTLTAVLFVPLLLCAFVTEMLGSRIMAYRAASRSASGRLTAFLADLLAGQLALKVAGAEPHAVARLAELGNERRRAEVRDSAFDAVLGAFNLNLGNLGTGVVLLLGAQAIHAGTFTVGEFALFVVYLDTLGWYPAEIGRVVGGLKQSAVSIQRMQAIVPGESPTALVTPAPVYLRRVPRSTFHAPSGEIGSESPRARRLMDHVRPGAASQVVLPELPLPPARERLERLEVQGLTYNHPGGGRGIFDISFTLERGTLTVVTGRIGAGKTTLLQVLLGLLPRATGEIRWNGRPVEDPATFFVPPRSAYTPQSPRLFGETVRENVLLGWPADLPALERAIHAAVLDPDVGTFENGLDTLLGPRGVRLSGGQAQRVAAARMFIREAELLICDDLSSALDVETEAELWSRVFARGGAQTFLVVSHRPAVIRQADQVLVMENGHRRPDVTGECWRCER